MRVFTAMLTMTAAAALSTGCSSAAPDPASLPAHSATPTRPAATTRAPTATTAPNATTATATTATGTTFCATVRRLGLDSLGIAQDRGTAPNDLVPNLDKLDAIAPTAIHADFHRFTQLEHALLATTKPDPAVLAHLNSPDVAHSLRHVGDYLRITCGIGTS